MLDLPSRLAATTAHIAVESMSAAISPLVSLLFLIISYVYYAKLNKYKARQPQIEKIKKHTNLKGRVGLRSSCLTMIKKET